MFIHNNNLPDNVTCLIEKRLIRNVVPFVHLYSLTSPIKILLQRNRSKFFSLSLFLSTYIHKLPAYTHHTSSNIFFIQLLHSIRVFNIIAMNKSLHTYVYFRRTTSPTIFSKQQQRKNKLEKFPTPINKRT